MERTASKTILYCVLNWGLGHATRSMPIINHLLAEGHKVLLASDGRAGTLLQKEFPSHAYFHLNPYGVTYSRSLPILHLLRQIPKVSAAVRQEKRLVEEIVREQAVDVVISDNRFGCYSAHVPSVIISHQIDLKVRGSLVKRMATQANLSRLRRFRHLWIPDLEKVPGFAGSLSHGRFDLSYSYLGLLSRFKSISPTKKYDWVAVISGPEPLRSHFESMLRNQLKTIPGNHVLVGGRTESHDLEMDGNVRVIGHLEAAPLNELFASAERIISRTGYSSMMDLAVIAKPVLWVPTPGQPEQEYLGELLAAEGYSVIEEKALNLKDHTEQAMKAFAPVSNEAFQKFKEEVDIFLAQL